MLQQCTDVFTCKHTWDMYKQAVVCTSGYKSGDKIGLTELGMA